MIKYEIKRKLTSWMGDHGFEYKTVKKSELESHLKDVWIFHRKKYFIFTHCLDWYKDLSIGNKIGVFAIFISSFMGLLLWSVDKYLDNKNEKLNSDFQLTNRKLDSLKKDSELLTQRYDSLTYTLTEKNKLIENLKEELKTKTSSDKK